LALLANPDEKLRPRLRKADRRAQILHELKLRPHLRISELANRFGVSGETVRRDVDELSKDGLISRDHGGISAPALGHYPTLDERSRARLPERERIGRGAARLVAPGDTLMIDSGSTTLQLARFLAYFETPCTVITNSLPVAMTLGRSEVARVINCPGDYVASEAAVIGVETVRFLEEHSVDRCFIGASAISTDGVSESVRGFAAIKRTMLARSKSRHLLIDSEKFGGSGLSRVGVLSQLTSIVVDAPPDPKFARALKLANVEVHIAPSVDGV